MNERMRNVAVGVTSLAGLVALGFLLFAFGYVPAWIERGYSVKIEVDSASGLTTGSRVRMLGYDIGRVASVALIDGQAHRPIVVVDTLIRQNVKIPRGVHVKTEVPLLGGSPSLAFDLSHLNTTDPDYEKKMQPLPTDGSAVLHGESLNLVSEFARQLQSAMSEPARSFDKLASSFDRLSQEWVEVGKNINQLLGQRSVAEVDQGQAVGNLPTVLARADQRLKELQTTIAGLNKWVTDEELRRNIQQTAANSRDLTARLNTSVDKANRLFDAAGQNFDKLTKRYLAVADDLSATTRTLQQTIDQARQGDGTLGKLLKDPALYDNLNDTAKRMNAALTEFKLLIEKWKKEGLPVQF